MTMSYIKIPWDAKSSQKSWKEVDGVHGGVAVGTWLCTPLSTSEENMLYSLMGMEIDNYLDGLIEC